MRILTYILLLLIAVVGVTFASLNAELVPLNYYLGIKQLPLSLLLMFVFVVGSFFGFLFGFFMYLRSKRALSQCHKRIKMTEKEIENLRALPIEDKH